MKYNKPVVTALTETGQGSAASSEVGAVLNKILPPKGWWGRVVLSLPQCFYLPVEWEEDGLGWKQEVSCTPSLRKDVVTVRSELDNLLVDRQARDTGICQVGQYYHSKYHLMDSSVRSSVLSNSYKNNYLPH